MPNYFQIPICTVKLWPAHDSGTHKHMDRVNSICPSTNSWQGNKNENNKKFWAHLKHRSYFAFFNSKQTHTHTHTQVQIYREILKPKVNFDNLVSLFGTQSDYQKFKTTILTVFVSACMQTCETIQICSKRKNQNVFL